LPPLSRYALYLATSEAKIRNILHAYVTRWQYIEPVTDGHTLKAQGLSPSPRYRQILSELRNAWLDGRITSSEGK